MARASDPVPVDIAGIAPGGVAIQYRRGDGRVVDAGRDRVPVDEVLAGLPVRDFRSWRGRKLFGLVLVRDDRRPRPFQSLKLIR